MMTVTVKLRGERTKTYKARQVFPGSRRTTWVPYRGPRRYVLMSQIDGPILITNG